MSFTKEQIEQNKNILNQILTLMESENITVNQAEKICELLPHEFEKNRKLSGSTQKFSVCKN